MSYLVLQIPGQAPKKVFFPNTLTLQAMDGSKFRLARGAVHQGGNGAVFAAEQLGPHNQVVRQCAVKLLKQLSTTRRDRFANEVRILRALDHPRIVKCYGEGSVDLDGVAVPWMAMDLGENNLRFEVENHGPLHPDNLLVAGIHACQALGHLHGHGIIHRDVKPENFVFQNAKNDDLMMIDLGIAKYVGEDVSGRPMDEFTASMEFVGPVFFASPELIHYKKDKGHRVDHRSDLFQLGKVIWYLATGTISAGIISKSKCRFGGKLWDLCCSLLQDDPNDRPNDIAEVERALRAL